MGQHDLYFYQSPHNFSFPSHTDSTHLSTHLSTNSLTHPLTHSFNPSLPLKKPPLPNLETLQHLLPNRIRIPHQPRNLLLLLLAFLGLVFVHVLARVVGRVDGDEDVGAVFLEAQ